MAGRVMEALSVMDRRLSGGAAPAAFTDRCIDAGGAVIASGPSVGMASWTPGSGRMHQGLPLVFQSREWSPAIP